MALRAVPRSLTRCLYRSIWRTRSGCDAEVGPHLGAEGSPLGIPTPNFMTPSEERSSALVPHFDLPARLLYHLRSTGRCWWRLRAADSRTDIIAMRRGPFFQPETKIFGRNFSSESVVSNEILYLAKVLEEKDALRLCLLSPEV